MSDQLAYPRRKIPYQCQDTIRLVCLFAEADQIKQRADQAERQFDALAQTLAELQESLNFIESIYKRKMTSKQTTTQVAKALGLTKQRIYTLLRSYPHLRPCEQQGRVTHYLWSEAEIAALQAHLVAHPSKRQAAPKNRRLTGAGQGICGGKGSRR